MLTIGEISENVPIVSVTSKSIEVNSLFEENPDLEGIVVAENNKPAGLVMKAQFYRKISTKYGFDLFMGRSIDLIMDKNPLIVDYYEPIALVSSKAMTRSQKNLYDYVVVIHHNSLFGIVSIKNLLIKLAEIQVSKAMFTNPLSGLPGNVLIEEKVLEYLKTNVAFSLLYLDLDHFKAYNDTYGFMKGDLLIKETSKLLSKNIRMYIKGDSFIGHIGGDDFIAILPNYEYEKICNVIINDFDNKIKDFYDVTDWENKFVYTKDRYNQDTKIPLVSLSIAVVTNEHHTFQSMEEISQIAAEVKKQCKAGKNSCFIVYQKQNCLVENIACSCN